MGHGFLGMERDPWPPTPTESDSDPVVTRRKDNLLLWLIPRVVIGLFLVFVVEWVFAKLFAHSTTNASYRAGQQIVRSAMTRVVDLDSLTAAERIELIGELWDGLQPEPDELPVDAELARELAKRVAAYDADSSSALPWNEVRQRILGSS